MITKQNMLCCLSFIYIVSIVYFLYIIYCMYMFVYVLCSWMYPLSTGGLYASDPSDLSRGLLTNIVKSRSTLIISGGRWWEAFPCGVLEGGTNFRCSSQGHPASPIDAGSLGMMLSYLLDLRWSEGVVQERWHGRPLDSASANLISPSLFAVGCSPKALERDVWQLRKGRGGH
jgi:hypothetical protein